jgi:copper oxidase (laccase) domain-containing protein
MTFEVSYDQDGFEVQPDRYQRINALNRESFLMHEMDSLQVIQSLHSVGARRDALTPGYASDLDAELVRKAASIGRRTLVGNTSPLNGYGPKELEPAERIEDANANLSEFFLQNNIDTNDVRMLLPERDYTTPLGVINLDTVELEYDTSHLLKPSVRGDFMYTHNPDLVLAARPADCPIVFISGETTEGQVTVLLHLAWKGVANGYIEQAVRELRSLGVEWDSIRAQITPGGQAASFTFENYPTNPRDEYPGMEGMFSMPIEKNLTVDGKEVNRYDFSIDLPGEVYDQIISKWGIDPYQVFLDTTDTTSPTVGYSSHSRSFKGYEQSGENSRDIVVGRREHSRIVQP